MQKKILFLQEIGFLKELIISPQSENPLQLMALNFDRVSGFSLKGIFALL